MTVELEKFISAQKAPEDVPADEVAGFQKWLRFLEEHGCIEFFEDPDGDVDYRVTDEGDQLFGTLGAAIPFERLVVLFQIRMGEVLLAGGDPDDEGDDDAN